jgi:hypothetical protein
MVCVIVAAKCGVVVRGVCGWVWDESELLSLISWYSWLAVRRRWFSSLKYNAIIDVDSCPFG